MNAEQAPPGALAEAVALQAAEWFFLLQTGEATEADRRRWIRWHGAHPSHALAWERAQRVGQAFAQLPPAVALPVLGRARRRTAVRALALLLVAAPPGWLAWRHTPARDWLAGHRTATGAGQALALADGTRLQLDTASAVDIEFDSAQRLIRLRSGAIHVQTAPDPQAPPRPLRVATAQGMLQALGTRFTVRQEAGHTRVAVFEGAVEVRPARAPGQVVRVDAGQGAVFSGDLAQSPVATQESAAAWARGVLVADNMPLGELVAELARYRTGLLRCDPQVAGLRVTGVFSLRDTDRALHNLALGLPVQVVARTRYWVTVQAAG